MAKLLSGTRKKILVYWYQYHNQTNFWPTFRDAAEALKLSVYTIHYHVKILIEEEWMDKNKYCIVLTKYGEGKIFEASLIASGEKRKELSKGEMLANKLKKKSK